MSTASFSGLVDYSARVRELQAVCQNEWGVDPAQMGVVAACLLRITSPVKPVWLICDAPKQDWWITLGNVLERIGWAGVASLPAIRSIRPRYANVRVDECMEFRGYPRIFHDHVWSEPAPYTVHPRNKYPELEAECLRMRVHVSWLKTPSIHAPGELERCLKLVLDPERRPYTPIPLPNPPEMLQHAVKMVVTANPGLRNPSATLQNALLLPTAHAVAHGRDKLMPVDHEITYRVLTDTVRPWTLRILRAFAENDGYMSVYDLQSCTDLPHGVVVSECARLAREEKDGGPGLVEWPKPNGGKGGSGGRRKWLRLTPGLGDDMKSFVRGDMKWW